MATYHVTVCYLTAGEWDRDRQGRHVLPECTCADDALVALEKLFAELWPRVRYRPVLILEGE